MLNTLTGNPFSRRKPVDAQPGLFLRRTCRLLTRPVSSSDKWMNCSQQTKCVSSCLQTWEGYYSTPVAALSARVIQASGLPLPHSLQPGPEGPPQASTSQWKRSKHEGSRQEGMVKDSHCKGRTWERPGLWLTDQRRAAPAPAPSGGNAPAPRPALYSLSFLPSLVLPSIPPQVPSYPATLAGHHRHLAVPLPVINRACDAVFRLPEMPPRPTFEMPIHFAETLLPTSLIPTNSVTGYVVVSLTTFYIWLLRYCVLEVWVYSCNVVFKSPCVLFLSPVLD